MALFGPLFDELNEAGVRYIVVGGLAVVLHGFPRLTGDVDLIVDLEPAEARKAIAALVRLGLQPRVPVDPAGFADPATRAAWIAEKGMRVFTMIDTGNRMRVVDLFVSHPIPFEEMWGRARLVPVGRTTVRVAAIPDLIELKRLSGRPRDLEDIVALEAIVRRGGGR